jgi:fluoroacetyl-CoA thioesterase
VGVLDNLAIGMTSETTTTVSPEMTVGHFVAGVPQVHATPMMILHMQMASGAAIASHLPEGFVSVGMDVKVARVLEIDRKSVVFEVEAWDGNRKICDGTHRQGIVNVVEFEKRFGVKRARHEPGLTQSRKTRSHLQYDDPPARLPAVSGERLAACHTVALRAGGAMNSGPTGSVTVSRRICSISALADASSDQPVTSSTGCSWPG